MPISKLRKNRKVEHLPAGHGTGKPMAGFKTYGGKGRSNGSGAGPRGTKTPKLTDPYRKTMEGMDERQRKVFERNIRKANREGLKLAWPGWRVKAAFHLQYLINRGLTPSFNA